MADSPPTSPDPDADGGDGTGDGDGDGSASDERTPEDDGGAATPADAEREDLSEEELRRAVEEKYDFDDFGPADMAEMSIDEWEAAFDAETWITGEELLDRVERDLKARIARREVFAVLERVRSDDEELLLVYSDEDYALVYPDGTIEGTGTVLRDVKPTVALCSIESYDVEEPPEGDFLLPEPGEVPEQSGELGNLMLQVIAGVQLLAGVGLLFGSAYFAATETGETGTWLITGAAGLGFLAIGLFLLVTVANARLSDRFRSEEYRDRLRKVGLEDGERPDFLPIEGPDAELEPVDAGDE